MKTAGRLPPPLLIEDITNELAISVNLLITLLKQTPRIRLLFLALFSGIIAYYTPNTLTYVKGAHNPPGIIVDFVYLYTKDMLAAFIPFISGEESIPNDRFLIKVKKDTYNECMLTQPEKFALF